MEPFGASVRVVGNGNLGDIVPDGLNFEPWRSVRGGKDDTGSGRRRKELQRHGQPTAEADPAALHAGLDCLLVVQKGLACENGCSR